MGDTINTNTTLTSQVSSHTSGNANTFLRSLFKKYYAVFDSVAKTDSGAVDDSNNIGDTKPPQVFALNPYTCTTAGKDCVATFENAFTVNNRNYVAGEAADYDANDVLDIMRVRILSWQTATCLRRCNFLAMQTTTACRYVESW